MEEKIYATGEHASIWATLAITIGGWMSHTNEWMNENHLAVISYCAIVTAISGVVFGVLRYRLRSKELKLMGNSK